ncbi:MAG: ethanolamine ammonia-lyase subunit EutC [Acidobacteriota bacterium]
MRGELDKAPVTAARIALGRSGPAIATRESLRFQLDHALARDAIGTPLDVGMLERGLASMGFSSVVVRSAVRETAGRREYLLRPDLGRRLDAGSAAALEGCAGDSSERAEVVFVMADGLSALAVERHALGLLDAVRPLVVGPVVIAREARVALGDEIGERLRARLTVMLIGERPGLSAADSLGVYLTWEPKVGRTDAERNCISNVRGGGLSYAEAARRVGWYVGEARRLGVSGVAIKDPVRALAVGD